MSRKQERGESNQFQGYEDRHLLFFEHSPDGILFIEDKLIRDCNKAAMLMLKITDKEQIIGLNPYRLSPPFQPDGQSSKRKSDAMMAEALVKGRCRFEWVHRSCDKSEFTCEVLLFAVSGRDKKALCAIWHDIGERKIAEEALKQSEEKYSNIFKHANWGIFQTSREGRLISINEAFARLFGFDTIEDMTSSVTDISTQLYVDPSDRKKFIGIMEKRSMVEHCEAEFYKKNGGRLWISMNARAVRDINGETLYYEGTLEDITERKRAEDSLRESEKFLTDVVDFLPDATFVVDQRKKIIIWNRAVETMTGIPAADMLGKSDNSHTIPFYGYPRHDLMDLIWQQDTEHETAYQNVKRDGDAICAEAFCPALYGGKGAYLVAKASPIYDHKGDVIAAIESIRDISDIKETEAALHRSIAQFRLLCENIPLGITLLNPDGAISYINPQFEGMFGYSVEDLPHIEELLMKLTDNDQECAIIQACMQLKNNINRTLGLRCKNGVRKVVHMRSSLIDGDIQLIAYQDVTMQQKMEAQLRQSQKMEAIGTLAGGIAHDFNNILGAVIGYTEMALRDISDEQTILRRYLEQVLKGSERARDLVKQILAFSRQTEQIVYPLKVSPLIKESIKLLRASIPSNIRIDRKIEAHHDTICAEPVQIHQIVMNLCTNATFAMKEMNGVLTITLRNVHLDEDHLIHSDLSAGDYLQLTVRDTGRGIDPKIIDRIFEPFFTTKGLGEGTGMGLAVVHGIVQSCSGMINVKSELGMGATFEAYFPLYNKVDVALKENNEKTITPGKERILFVDDNESLVILGKEMLSSIGYCVTAKTNSLQALATFRSNPYNFDLVITDFMMPALTGYELSKALVDIRPDIPIILCTGYFDILMEDSARTVGIREVVLKPLTLHDISSTIKKVLHAKP